MRLAACSHAFSSVAPVRRDSLPPAPWPSPFGAGICSDDRRFSVSNFAGVARGLQEAAPRRRVRAARGWLGGGVLGQAYPPVSLLIPPKNIFDSKIPGERV